MSRIEVDSVYHLSCSSKSGIVFGAGITKGSSGTTTNGENIKAGSFPVLFYGYSKSPMKESRTLSNNKRIQRRGNRIMKLSLKRSSVNQGNSNSD